MEKLYRRANYPDIKRTSICKGKGKRNSLSMSSPEHKRELLFFSIWELILNVGRRMNVKGITSTIFRAKKKIIF